MQIVSEQPGHIRDIDSLLRSAFGRPDEARLVGDLRAERALAFSLVATTSKRVCGHLALSRLLSPERSLALAPLAVAPAEQRRGVGALLVRAALELAAQGGWASVFVLGSPAYYNRFGFTAAAAEPYASPFAGPHFMALALPAGAAAPAPVVYAAAFTSAAHLTFGTRARRTLRAKR